MKQTPPLILASTSRYRRELLQRLAIPFDTMAPDADETVLPHETADALVYRLAGLKARAVGAQVDRGLVIGSDQVATIDGDILGKSGSREAAIEQLHRLSGREVTFLTGLCLYNVESGAEQSDVVPFHVVFRRLSQATIARYVDREEPFDCAGSFKSEGLGITLFERMEGTDPTALVGLPLIRLTDMLLAEGVQLP